MHAAWNSYFQRRYAVLFYSLVLTLAAGPLSDALGFDAGLIELCLAVNLLTAMLPMGNSNTWRVAFISLLGIALLMRVGAVWLGRETPTLASLAIWTLAGLLAAASALRFAVRTGSVGREHIYAALSAYLLAGSFFGILYWVVERIWSGSFAIAGDFTRLTAVYFSFVTMATLGYGDVVPRTDLARGLAIIEGIGGQLFLAVLVARLVALYAGTQNSR